MTDLSKLDWKKLRLPDYEGAQLTVDYIPKMIEQVRIKNRSIVVATRTTIDEKHPWRIHGECCVTAFVEHVLKCKDIVDAFIAAETACLTAEEEAANWLEVPCQDAEWLRDNGASVRVLDDEIREWVPFQRSVSATHRSSYVVDRRTVPDGYDPMEPRWVDIKNGDVCALDGRKCSIRALVHGKWVSLDDYCKSFTHIGAEHGWRVDIHTIPPGVPLHEEPKPVPRSCSKEFALAHPGESEYKLVPHATWYPMRGHTGDSPPYEFRTTAKGEEYGTASGAVRKVVEFTRSAESMQGFLSQEQIGFINTDVVRVRIEAV